MDYYIFGAQAIALGAIHAYGENTIKAVVVSNMKGNPSALNGLPVLTVGELANSLSEQERKNSIFIIATPDDIQSDIEEVLESYGFSHYHRLDSQDWAEIMGLYYRQTRDFPLLRTLPKGVNKSFLRVYVACFEKDRFLYNSYEYPVWMEPLQVGAEGASRKIARLLDNQGESISSKNRNYCELTGLYWLWKNKLIQQNFGDNKQYYGLFQYRRMLMLSDDDILRLSDNEVDVILPYPMIYEPNISVHHKKYLSDSDWHTLLKAIDKCSPEYIERIPEIMSQQYLYNYNIIIAEKNVLYDYCQWLFTILHVVEMTSVPLEKYRSDRYLGYMGESLATIYFMMNKDRLNIRHVGCRMLC